MKRLNCRHNYAYCVFLTILDLNQDYFLLLLKITLIILYVVRFIAKFALDFNNYPFFGVGNNRQLVMTKLYVNRLDFSGKRVRYEGKVCDKCFLSLLIEQASFAVKGFCGTLVTSIYWDSMKYDELASTLMNLIDRIMLGDVRFSSRLSFDL